MSTETKKKAATGANGAAGTEGTENVNNAGTNGAAGTDGAAGTETEEYRHAGDITQSLVKGTVNDALLGALEGLDDEQFTSLQGQYFKFQPNKTYPGLVVYGITQINDKFAAAGTTSMVDAVQIYMRDPLTGKGAEMVTCESVLLNSVKDLIKKDEKNIPGAFRLITGEIKTSPKTNFKYLSIEVKFLKPLQDFIAPSSETVDTETGEVIEG